MLKARVLISLLSAGTVLNPSQAASIPGAGMNIVPKALYLKHTPLTKRILFTVHLNLRNKEKLDALFQQIYDPKSPNYQHYLSSEAYKQAFAPDAQSLALVKNYFNDLGMQAEMAGDKIEVKATIAQVEQAFKIQINNYRYQNKPFYAATSLPQVDRAIANHISEISGLNSFPRFHPMMHRTQPLKGSKVQTSSKVNQARLRALYWPSSMATAMPTDNSLNGFSGKDLRKTYRLGQVAPVNGTSINGFGQTVVILDSCGANSPQQILDDANQFSLLNGLPQLIMTDSGPGPKHQPYFSVVNKAGTPISSCESKDWQGEIALDIAAVHTLAPYANIVLVIDKDLDIGTLIDNIVTTPSGNTFAQFPNSNIISNSWDGNESHYEPFLEGKLQEAAMRGISVNFASSDCGDQTYNNGFWPCQKAENTPTVEYPASSTYTTAVGGTSLFVDKNWNYAFETGWGSYSVHGIEHHPHGFLAGSTGGISKYFPAPPWQQNTSFQNFTAGGYGLIGSYGNKRAIPDIAMLADLFTGLIVYEHLGCNKGCINGGTSLSTPLFSGTLALINQARALQNKPTLGLASAYLYYNANQTLSQNQALNFVVPPHRMIDKTGENPTNAPLDAFTLFDNTVWYNTTITFNWDASLTLNENQYWNDVVGVGTPYIPNFVAVMANL